MTVPNVDGIFKSFSKAMTLVRPEGSEYVGQCL